MPHHRLAATRWTFVAAGAAIGASLLACALKVSGLAEPDGTGEADAGDESVSGGDSRSDVGAIDASDGSPSEAAAPCVGGDAGPELVAVGSYCIDKTEVTAAQYDVFLEAMEAGAAVPLPPSCAGKASFVPGAPRAQGNYPVVSVDWCDAFAFCAWAGKRLCGRIGGGANAPADYADAGASQWYRVCSFAGARTYPYGNTYEPATCNGLDFDAGAAVPVASTACLGAFPGVHDFSGNAWEWEDSCAGQGPTDVCRIRGGSFANSRNLLSCDADNTWPRDRTHATLGFRCCSAP